MPLQEHLIILLRKLIQENIDEIKLRRNNILTNGHTVKSYVSGEKHFVFGKEYTLEVKIDRKNSVSFM